MNNIKRSAILGLMLLASGSNLVISDASADVANSSIAKPVFKYLVLPSAFAGTLYYMNHLRDKKIQEISKLPKKWMENQDVDPLKFGEYDIVSKDFHYTAWRLGKFVNNKYQFNGYSPYIIYDEVESAKEKKDMKIMVELLEDIKGAKNGEQDAFVLDTIKQRVVDGTETTDDNIVKALIKTLVEEMKALKKDIQKIPYHEDIERTFLDFCGLRSINKLHHLTDHKLNEALTSVADSKTKGIKFLDKWFDFDQSEPYQLLCKFWSKKYNAAIDAYLKLIPLYAKLSALRAMAVKYKSLSSRTSGSSRMNAHIDIMPSLMDDKD